MKNHKILTKIKLFQMLNQIKDLMNLKKKIQQNQIRCKKMKRNNINKNKNKKSMRILTQI